MKFEKFEQEYSEEIKGLKALRFQTVETPEFKIPGYKFVFSKAVSIAFAVPAIAFVFAFIFYPSQNPYNQDLAKIEASNMRIMNQIDTLDYENTNS